MRTCPIQKLDQGTGLGIGPAEKHWCGTTFVYVRGKWSEAAAPKRVRSMTLSRQVISNPRALHGFLAAFAVALLKGFYHHQPLRLAHRAHTPARVSLDGRRRPSAKGKAVPVCTIPMQRAKSAKAGVSAAHGRPKVSAWRPEGSMARPRAAIEGGQPAMRSSRQHSTRRPASNC